MNEVVTRFPPSPTGFLHIGRARTALFNYLFAKQNGGRMLFRYEDTDKARSKKEFEENMLESLKWLGISWDNAAIERQSERAELYKKYLKKILDANLAYPSKEKITEGEKAGQENEVIRFKNPNKKVKFTDLIRGEIEFDTTDLGDFIIARNIDDPLYHLAVVVDDFEMGVTHIIRGDDGISNTPRQILIQEAIGAPLPTYAHLPLILAPDRSKLSGRHGAVSVTDYKDKGYLPEAIVNYLALLGWNPGTNEEIFSLDELIKRFDLSKVQKAGAIFNIEKLNWLNKEYIKRMPRQAFIARAAEWMKRLSLPAEMLEKIAPIITDRIEKFSDIEEMEEKGELDYFAAPPVILKEKLSWKGDPAEKVKIHLEAALSLLEKVHQSDFNKENVKQALWPYAEKEGRGNVLWPLRYSLSGKDKSPDPFTLAEIFGREETFRRLKTAVNLLS